MNYKKDYCYCDANYEDRRTHKKSAWRRMKVTEVPRRIIGVASSQNCYMTVQRFKDSVCSRELGKKIEWAKKKLEAGKLTKDGAKEKELERIDRMEADHLALPDMQMHYNGLFFDFDADYKKLGGTEVEAISLTRTEVCRLVEWFNLNFDLNPAHLQIWFSGKKGFHVTVRPEPFGIKPHLYLNRIVKVMALELAHTLELTTLDQSIYSIARMWRIPGTSHPDTGRYKIELTHDELTKLSIEELFDLSKVPRGYGKDPGYILDSVIFDKEEYDNIAPDGPCSNWWNGYFEIWSASHDQASLRPMAPIVMPEAPSGKKAAPWPDCIEDIYKNGPKEGGPGRNRTLLPLAGFFRDAGYIEEEATQQISDWTNGHFGHDQSQLRRRQANGLSVVRDAYHGNTRFACKFIRSLKGSGPNGIVKCCREENCAWIQDPEDQQQSRVAMVQLGEASKPCYQETKVCIPIHIAAVGKTPYGLPIKGIAKCIPDPEAKMCERCPNSTGADAGKMEWEFSVDDRIVLKLFAVNDITRRATMKAHCGIPQKCPKVDFKTLEKASCEEVQIIPMVDFASVYTEDNSEDDEATKGSAHVVRTAFHIGHGIQANKKYLIEASVFDHPNDQGICFVFDKKEGAQSDIDTFKMTDDLYNSLRQFQPNPGQSVEDKMVLIHKDFTANVHRIGGRNDLSMSVDLCYHSVVGFTFASTKEKKGWFELLIVGDTGTGKSTLVERMQQHYNLGELISGEGARRTALLSANIQMHSHWVLQWGKMPQNDRRLLIIDEFAEIPIEEIAKLTQVRSSGIAQGLGVNSHYETYARTRLICISNPRDNNGSLQGFTYGIDAVSGVYGNKVADLRRVDLCVICDKNDVSTKLVMKRWDKVDYPHTYTADMCRNLILWVWSRDPRHVVFTPDAEDRCIQLALKLANTYDCDISLAERSDFKIKLARISVSVAARMFSTDRDAKKLFVKSEHIEFAAKFMDSCYRKPSMAYFEYARRYKADNEFTDERKEEISEYLGQFDDAAALMSNIMDLKTMTKSIFADAVNLEGDDLKKLWRYLINSRLITRSAKSYKKSSAFTKFLQGQDSSRRGNETEFGKLLSTGDFDGKDESESDEDFFVPDISGNEPSPSDDEPDF